MGDCNYVYKNGNRYLRGSAEMGRGTSKANTKENARQTSTAAEENQENRRKFYEKIVSDVSDIFKEYTQIRADIRDKTGRNFDRHNVYFNALFLDNGKAILALNDRTYEIKDDIKKQGYKFDSETSTWYKVIDEKQITSHFRQLNEEVGRVSRIIPFREAKLFLGDLQKFKGRLKNG